MRIQYPGALYHVINRGNYRRDLFESVGAAESFLAALGGGRGPLWVAAARVCGDAQSLPPGAGDAGAESGGRDALAAEYGGDAVQSFPSGARAFVPGPQSILLEDVAALARVVDYIHLNPVRACVVEVGQLCGYRWSSLVRFLRGTRFAGMEAADWLRARGGWSDDPEGWQAYRDYLTALASDEAAQRREGLLGLSRGWAIGTTGWRKAIATEHAHLKLSPGMASEQIAELKRAAWERRLDEALASLRKTRADLGTRPRVVEWKLALARDLRGAGIGVAWLAEHLPMGKAASLRSVMCRANRAKSQQSAA